MRVHLPDVVREERGAVLVEFAMIAPVLVFTLLGVFEIGYNFYIQSQLQGTVQKAARTATIENAYTRSDTIDAAVRKAVHRIAPRAELDFNRQAYTNFSGVAQPEDFKDVNDDGICNFGEIFEDANGNGQWDRDRGREGFGGARDVVLYTVTVSYPRAFGVSQMIGFSENVEFEAATVLRNQPFDKQDVSVTSGYCR